MKRISQRLLRLLFPVLAVVLAVLVIKLALKQRNDRLAQEQSAAQTEDGVLSQRQAYSTLTYQTGSATLSFTLEEDGTWVWADDPDFPLDGATVTAIISLVTDLKTQQTITDGDTADAYGLDDPVATLTAGGDGQESLTLAFGNATTDGNSYYMMKNGDESTVYTIADTLYNYLSVPIYDMMRLPELPELSARQLQSITLRGYSAAGDQTSSLLTTLTAQQDGDSVTWRSGGANVTDDATVQALLADVSALAFEKCVDYRPSDDAAALCGFDEPAAVLTLNYTTDTGSSQTLTLTIGSPLPDGSGRYARMADDSTIYLLSTAALDPLMRVSVSGLEP